MNALDEEVTSSRTKSLITEMYKNYSSVVQPCCHSPHVATGSLNVATTTIY